MSMLNYSCHSQYQMISSSYCFPVADQMQCLLQMKKMIHSILSKINVHIFISETFTIPSFLRCYFSFHFMSPHHHRKNTDHCEKCNFHTDLLISGIVWNLWTPLWHYLLPQTLYSIPNKQHHSVFWIYHEREKKVYNHTSRYTHPHIYIVTNGCIIHSRSQIKPIAPVYRRQFHQIHHPTAPRENSFSFNSIVFNPFSD